MTGEREARKKSVVPRPTARAKSRVSLTFDFSTTEDLSTKAGLSIAACACPFGSRETADAVRGANALSTVVASGSRRTSIRFEAFNQFAELMYETLCRKLRAPWGQVSAQLFLSLAPGHR